MKGEFGESKGYDNQTNIANLARKFSTIFAGRTDARGTLLGGCVKESLNLQNFINHLTGEESLGCYPLLDDGTCKVACVDFDFKAEPDRIKKAEREARRFAHKLFELGLNSNWFEG